MKTQDLPLPSNRTVLDDLRQSGHARELVDQIALRKKARRRRRRALTRAGAAILLLAVIGAWAIPVLRDTRTITLPVAQRHTVILGDGSTMELNAGTSVKTDYRYGRRTVRIDSGEAYFSIVGDPQHPFIVETPTGSVEVLGTEFNVRISSTRGTELTLIEGAVSARPSRQGPVMLTAGQQLLVDSPGAGPRSLTPLQQEQVTAWRNGRLVLDDTPLAEAIEKISAFHGRKISVDPQIANLRLGGSFPLDDLSRFIDALQITQALKVETLADGSYRISRK